MVPTSHWRVCSLRLLVSKQFQQNVRSSNKMKLKEKTVLITGGTSGIGLELAKQLLERGNTVIITGRGQEKLDGATRAIPGVHTFTSDVSDPEAIAALYAGVIARFPALDTLIN